MRIWSFHPKYLDNVGLSRAINESIKGYKALCKTGEGYPKSWEKHSQLIRFQESNPRILIYYIECLIDEKVIRWIDEIGLCSSNMPLLPEMGVTEEQLKYEWNHYLNKLHTRNYDKWLELFQIIEPEPHPIFDVVPGEIEPWEKVK